MRQLIVVICLLASSSAWAFSDSLTVQTTNSLIDILQREDKPNVRLQLLESYKQFLFKRLNTIELPDIATTPEASPLLEDYRSLTEYDGYINMIRLQAITPAACARTKVNIQNATSREGGLVPEAIEALKVLSALCRD